jgi:hypothetical protein
LHDAIDTIGEIFKRYTLLLSAGMYVSLEPFIQDGWKKIFLKAWVPS